MTAPLSALALTAFLALVTNSCGHANPRPYRSEDWLEQPIALRLAWYDGGLVAAVVERQGALAGDDSFLVTYDLWWANAPGEGASVWTGGGRRSTSSEMAEPFLLEPPRSGERCVEIVYSYAVEAPDAREPLVSVGYGRSNVLCE